MTSALAKAPAGSAAGLRTEGVLVGGFEAPADMTPLIPLAGGVSHGVPRDIPLWTATVMELLSQGYPRPRTATGAINDPWVADLILMGYAGAVLVAEVKAKPPGFFALAEQLMQTTSATIEQVAQLSGATRRTYYNWRKHGRAPEDARQRIARAAQWLERAVDEVPHLVLLEEVDPARAGSLGYLLAEGASDTALIERLGQLTVPTVPVKVRVVERLDHAEPFDEDELLDPGELAAMAAAAPRPRRRSSIKAAFEPAELTDSLRDDRD